MEMARGYFIPLHEAYLNNLFETGERQIDLSILTNGIEGVLDDLICKLL